MAIDRSGYKERIITFTISLAKPLGAEIIAIHVIDKSTIVPATDAFNIAMRAGYFYASFLLKTYYDNVGHNDSINYTIL